MKLGDFLARNLQIWRRAPVWALILIVAVLAIDNFRESGVLVSPVAVSVCEAVDGLAWLQSLIY